jgi:eukaryotic translation initiation factor 2-alpha kinase 3
MSSMFRSPLDITSDPDPSSQGLEDDIHDPSPAPLEPQSSATESVDGQATRLPSLTEEEMSWIHNLPPQAHGAIMNAALQEFYCQVRAAEYLSDKAGNEGQYTRSSPEAVDLGTRMYEYQAQNLSSRGFTHPNLESEEMRPLRQSYREGLDAVGDMALEAGSSPVPPERALSPFLRSTQARGGLPPRSRSALRRILPIQGAGHAAMPSITQTLSQIQIDPGSGGPNISSPTSSFPLGGSPISAAPLFMSRYNSEFSEIKMLGKGGYGKVYHAQNHVDGQHYAIKKIILNPKRFKKFQEGTIQELEGILNEILKEIRTLARLEHSNVVRYFGAWIESNVVPEFVAPSTPQRVASPARAIQDSPGRFNAKATPGLDIVFEEPMKVGTETDEGESSHGIEFEGPEYSGEPAGGHGIVFGEDSSVEDKDISQNPDERKARDRRASQATVGSQNSRKSTVHSSGADDDDEIESVPREADFLSRGQTTTTAGGADTDIFTDGNGERETRLVAEEKKFDGPTAVLHIQMSLHPLSLSTYLAPLPQAESSVVVSRHCYHIIPSVQLMLSILDGVEYLHAQGIVHRDLKPGNIFLAESVTPVSSTASINIHSCPSCGREAGTPFYLTPRIGDFGLVAEMTTNEPVPPSTAHVSSVTSPGKPVGTEFYRPPVRTASVDEKLDVFALGVLLFELLWKFDTRMERHMVLANLGKGVLPNDFAEKAGNGGKALENCISGMVRADAEKRYGCGKVRKCLEGILQK